MNVKTQPLPTWWEHHTSRIFEHAPVFHEWNVRTAALSLYWDAKHRVEPFSSLSLKRQAEWKEYAIFHLKRLVPDAVFIKNEDVIFK